MTVPVYVISWALIALGLFAGMWFGWRRRVRRDDGIVASSAAELTGEIVAEFPRASYVSTTPVGSPLERVALPGLRFKGFAAVSVRRDGVTIEVTGERPVRIPVAQVRGTGTAGGRIGKAVERDGLTLLRWVPETGGAAAAQTASETDGAGDPPLERVLESSFRLSDPDEQRDFAAAIDSILDQTSGTDAEMSAVSRTMNSTPTTQEDA